MVNNYEKMRRSNAKIKKWLLDNNFKCVMFFPHTRWSKDMIIDGIPFDGCCVNKDGYFAIFQCKTNEKPSKRLIEEYHKLNERYLIRCLFLVNFDRKGVSCFK